MTNQTAKTTKASGTEAKASGKQKFTEAELKKLGLDPAPYGFAKK